jgi:hypothetical protein
MGGYVANKSVLQYLTGLNDEAEANVIASSIKLINHDSFTTTSIHMADENAKFQG